MRRKRLLFWGGLALLLVGSTIAVLLVLLFHEPAFYSRAHIPPSTERRDVSRQLLVRLAELADHFKDEGDFGKKKPWVHNFAVEQINSYLEEDLLRGDLGEDMARRGLSAPRLAIESDRIRLAFRYGNDWWSTVVSLDFRVWLVPKEVNVVALEILGRRAGALPISAQFFVDQVTEMARKKNIDVTLYRHNGNPVALLRFQSDKMRPTAQLRRLELRPGMITVGGAPLEMMPQAMHSVPGQSLRIE
jgi:hypothetical protein